MGKKFSGRRPENQPMFTRPVQLDFEKRRLFFAKEYGLAPPVNPTVVKVGRTATFTVAASDAPGNVRAQADYICDGTDDDVEIQAAIDALPADGGKIVLSQGTFNIESSLVLDSYQTLQGFGRSTILTTTTANLDIITATGSSGSEKTGILIADLCIDGDYTSDCGILFTYVDYSIIRNVTSIDNDEGGIALDNCDNNIILGNSCSGNSAGIYLESSSYNTIVSNSWADNRAAGIYIYSSSYNTVAGNASQADYEGIHLFESSYITIIGNTCFDSGENGMWVEDSSDNTISGNTCSTGVEGIYLDGSSDNTVIGNTCPENYRGIHLFNGSNNTVIGNTCQGNDEMGIWVEVTSDSTIMGNTLTENSQDTTNTHDDIFIENNSDYNSVQGNTCRAGGETNKPRYGINIEDANCNGNKVINNDLYDDGFGTAPYNDSGTGTIYLEPSDTRDFLKYFGDRTLLSGGGISAHGDADGSVAIAACTAWSKETDSDLADGVFFSYAGKAKQTLTDLSVNLIYLDYNAGTPQIVVATSPVTYGFQQDHILIGVVFRQGTAVHIFQSSNIGIQGINRAFMHAVEHLGAHRSSGLVTSDGGSLALSITAGIIYAGLNRQATTVDGTTWSYWYTSDSGSTWTEDTSQSVLVQSYNDITSGKVALGTNKYGVHWVYVDYEGSQLHIVYGQGNYTAPQAEEAGVPSVLPPIVVGYGVLIAKIINQEGTNTLTITYPWTTVFTSSLATDHGSLAGLGDDDHPHYLLVADLENPPTEDESAKAPTSEWAFDHDADVDAHHAQVHASTHEPGGSDQVHSIGDDDDDTKWHFDEGADDDVARLDIAGTERMSLGDAGGDITADHWLFGSDAGIISYPKQSMAHVTTSVDQIIQTAKALAVLYDGETYDIQNEYNSVTVSGIADATSANQLKDTGAFTEAAVYYIGMWVWNTTDNTYTTVTGKTDNDTLDLTDDIMVDTETYTLYMSRFTLAEDGKYLCVGSIQFENIADHGAIGSYFYKNGAFVMVSSVWSSAAVTSFTSATVVGVVEGAKDDYIQHYCKHWQVGAEAIVEANVFFQVVKIA